MNDERVGVGDRPRLVSIPRTLFHDGIRSPTTTGKYEMRVAQTVVIHGLIEAAVVLIVELVWRRMVFT